MWKVERKTGTRPLCGEMENLRKVMDMGQLLKWVYAVHKDIVQGILCTDWLISAFLHPFVVMEIPISTFFSYLFIVIYSFIHLLIAVCISVSPQTHHDQFQLVMLASCSYTNSERHQTNLRQLLSTAGKCISLTRMCTWIL